MDLNNYRTLCVVAAVGSYAKAARELQVTEAALRAQIRMLEQHYSASFVKRAPRGITLSSEGWEVLTYARQIVKLDQVARERVQAHVQAGFRLLRVGAVVSVSATVVQMLSRFKEEHPDSHVQLTVARTVDLIEKVKSGKLDIAIVHQHGEEAKLDREVLLEYPAVLCVSCNQPWAARSDGVDLKELSDARLVLRRPGSASRKHVEAALRSRQMWHRLRPLMEVDNFESVREAVLSGAGIGFVPRLAVLPEITSGRLVEIPVRGLDIHMRLLAISSKGRFPAPLARGFRHAIEAYFSVRKDEDAAL